jgi:hypothetical protein
VSTSEDGGTATALPWCTKCHLKLAHKLDLAVAEAFGGKCYACVTLLPENIRADNRAFGLSGGGALEARHDGLADDPAYLHICKLMQNDDGYVEIAVRTLSMPYAAKRLQYRRDEMDYIDNSPLVKFTRAMLERDE